jgi:hypothetical protein
MDIVIEYYTKFQETVPTFIIPRDIVESECKQAIKNNKKVDWRKLSAYYLSKAPKTALF